ncbi:MAG TPA: hypothetical protein VMQ10_13275 [Spirochaetia bacterium]|nr:hypothetical protein [Spirochaetia bacterium]
MSEHHHEYRELLAKVMKRDRDSIEAHWELGELFAKHNEPVADIAMAIDRGVTFVADHIKIVQAIPTREDLAAVLENRDDITSWTVLIDWVKAGAPGQESEEEPDAGDISRQKRQGRGRNDQYQQGGIVLTVPTHIIKALADLGVNPREAMGLFWQNVSVNLIVNIAYAGASARPAATVSAFAPSFQEPVTV